jgi:DNA invertase Pin-like site-specific DNA recombinase
MGEEEKSQVMRAVIYLRVASSRTPSEGDEAISHQREACQRIAAKHGLTIVREYVDIGRPARLEQQVELRRLLNDLAEKHDTEYVVVWDYARLARDMTQLDEVISQLRARGAEVVTITGVEVAERFIRQQVTQAVIDEASADATRARCVGDPRQQGEATS